MRRAHILVVFVTVVERFAYAVRHVVGRRGRLYFVLRLVIARVEGRAYAGLRARILGRHVLAVRARVNGLLADRISGGRGIVDFRFRLPAQLRTHLQGSLYQRERGILPHRHLQAEAGRPMNGHWLAHHDPVGIGRELAVAPKFWRRVPCPVLRAAVHIHRRCGSRRG